MYIHLKSASTICTRFTGQFQCLFWSAFHFSYPKLSCKSLMLLKQTWSEQLMSDVLLRMFGSVISWTLFHFLLSFFLTSFSLPLIPHIHLSVSVRIFSTWHTKTQRCWESPSISASHPRFLLASLYGRIVLACEKMSWSGIFGVNSSGLIWPFLWKHIDWLKLSL